jgi:hypothetical protein
MTLLFAITKLFLLSLIIPPWTTGIIIIAKRCTSQYYKSVHHCLVSTVDDCSGLLLVPPLSCLHCALFWLCHSSKDCIWLPKFCSNLDLDDDIAFLIVYGLLKLMSQSVI